MKTIAFFIFLSLIASVYSEERQNKFLTVHVISHTHDDVGWLKTVDEYYYGANQSIQYAGVQYIIDSVVDSLLSNPQRKFIYVEIAFFQRWWREQTEYRKQQVRMLVQEGRLEFINGGYCMNDEATTHYQDIIDQMTLGHQFLWKEFGVKPRIGWHIDPFGHANSQASLFAQMGFDAFFFGRIDYELLGYLEGQKQLEFVWRGSESLGKSNQIFSHVLSGDYCYLNGFAFEGGDDPIQTDTRLFDVNVKQRADLFVSEILSLSEIYATDQILIFMGCDFQFMNALKNFKNMEKLMNYINNNPDYNMKVMYSTPSIYVDSIYAQNLTWTVNTQDFFPYASGPHYYWTGYYTSRPGIKGYVRSRANLLHSANKLLTFISKEISVNVSYHLELIQSLWEAQGILQHHDAVSGTEKQHVADDYMKRLFIGTVNAETSVSTLLEQFISDNGKVSPPTLEFCHYINESICDSLQNGILKGKTVSVILYNPLAWDRQEYIRLPSPISQVEVWDSSNNLIDFEVYSNTDGNFTIIFSAKIPAMGFNTFFITKDISGHSKNLQVSQKIQNQDVVISNGYYQLTFAANTSRLFNITNLNIEEILLTDQQFHYWVGDPGNDGVASGAYIFRPVGEIPIDFGNPEITLINGELVSEVQQIWNSWIKQVTRLYADSPFIEIESTIGPIDISDGIGKEIITRYSTSLDSQSTFYTDSEGLEMQQRIRNYRPINYSISEPISMNYYPYNEAIYIEDTEADVRLSIVSDRSRGCSSLSDGQLETMLHRRLLHTDLGSYLDPLNETYAIRTIDRLMVERSETAPPLMRSNAQFLTNPLIMAFSEISSPKQWINSYTTFYSPMNSQFPPNLHLLNFDILDNQILLRIHHLYGIGEDPIMSSPVTINLNSLFSNVQFAKCHEMTLTANQPLDQLHRLQWNTDDVSEAELKNPTGGITVTINPMEIRTFLCK